MKVTLNRETIEEIVGEVLYHCGSRCLDNEEDAEVVYESLVQSLATAADTAGVAKICRIEAAKAGD